MTSIQDVALKASVSASTVSRVLRGDKRISEATCQRVNAAVNSTGYQAKPAGRPRKVSRHWNLGVLYSPRLVINNHLISLCRDWITAIRQAVIKAEGHLEILSASEDCREDLIYKHTMDRQELHGVILLGAYAGDGYLEDLHARNVPAVLMNRRSERGEYSSVFADLYSGAQQAIEHLVALGHRKIALATLPPTAGWTARERYKGTIDALQRHGLVPVLDRQANAKFDDLASFESGCDQIIASKATALVCGDFAGIRYVQLLQKRGLRVPEDISVVGFDHLGLKADDGLELTSISYNKQRMGHLAVAMLMKLIRNADQLVHLEASVPTQLVQGGSTSSPSF